MASVFISTNCSSLIIRVQSDTSGCLNKDIIARALLIRIKEKTYRESDEDLVLMLTRTIEMPLL